MSDKHTVDGLMELVANAIADGPRYGPWTEWVIRRYVTRLAAQPGEPVALAEPLVLDRYDAGLLGGMEGMSAEWWQDYIRAELERAHDFYQQQADNASPPPQQGEKEASGAVGPQPVAWMWEYIGPDPMSSQIQPCARALHEMDPQDPPHPNHWRPTYPLYAHDVTVADPPVDVIGWQWRRVGQQWPEKLLLIEPALTAPDTEKRALYAGPAIAYGVAVTSQPQEHTK